jgi:hypothetical protein
MWLARSSALARPRAAFTVRWASATPFGLPTSFVARVVRPSKLQMSMGGGYAGLKLKHAEGAVQHQWSYILTGLISDETVGPINESQLLDALRQGKLTRETMIGSPTRTKGQWVQVRQVPGCLQALQAGEMEREELKKAEKAKRDAERAKRDAERAELSRQKEEARQLVEHSRLAEQQRQREEQERQRALVTAQPQYAPPAVAYSAPAQTLVIPSGHSPFQGAATHPAPQTTVVQIHQQVVVAQQRQSQALPALVNFLFPCWPGVGQLIQGRLVASLIWFILGVASAASMAVFVGFFLFPVVWLGSVVDAAMYDP